MSSPPTAHQPPRDPEHPNRYTAALAVQIESRWQREWAERDSFRAKNPGDPGFDASKPKFYCLDMFPYPSGAGLHIGHPEGYTATDIVCRYKRAKGFSVLHPMGWDAFGLPAEQYAIQTGIHPAITTRRSVDNFRRQLQRFGFSYDWSREFGTTDEDYYRWTQWIFLKIYDAWFDPEQGRARPIAELVAEMESGAFGVAPDGSRVRFGDGVSGARPPAGTRRWAELGDGERGNVIDGHRLAYRSQTTVNWCPKLGTVLANDEVIDGKSERGGFPVLRKPLTQWMFRITAYAERLLSQLDGLDWPTSTKAMQAEWIGKSEGAEIEFPLALPGTHNPDTHERRSTSLRVFTTRPDTIFGATYMVVAPEHELCEQIASGETGVEPGTVRSLKEYVAKARHRSDIERQENKEKTGVFTGVYAVNPATGEKIPVWAADYVLMGYGTGAIMAVPAHDERDFEFAKKFNLRILAVVDPGDKWMHTCRPEQQFPNYDPLDPNTWFSLYSSSPDLFGSVFSGDGCAINSTNSEISLDKLPTADAKCAIIAWFDKTGYGRGKINYKLRDWTFSRQRYWGEPFPIVYDETGRAYPIQESHLPVKLPELADYAPEESDDPKPLLAKASAWAHTTAGEAGVDPKLLPPSTRVSRETNTMPGSAGSSWYAIRYCDARNGSRFVGKDADRYWMGGTASGGVDLYLGGSEHAVGHLLYSRFWQNVLFDLGEVSTPEPFRRLVHQGLITSFAYQRADKSIVPVDEVKEVIEGPDQVSYVEIATGTPVTPIVTKMSKRYKNVVNPDDVIAEFGADTCRLYEMYMGPLEASKPWNPRDITGCFRFLQRAWRLCVDEGTGSLRSATDTNAEIEKLSHRLIAKIEADIERLAFNTAIAAMMEFVNAATSAGGLTAEQTARFVRVLEPFAPHLAEELWSKLGARGVTSGLACDAPWPSVDPALLRDDQVELPVQIMGKVRGRVTIPADADESVARAAALAEPKIAEAVAGKSIKKVIFVRGKMINLVLG